MKESFEIIDHTADVGIIVYGINMKELFSNAATALFSLITDPESIKENSHLNVEVDSQDRSSLLIEWLNELIYLFDVEHILFNRFDIENLSHSKVKATCYGESFNPAKHKVNMEIKAATYHMLKLDKDNGGYKAQIIFDI